MNWESRCIRTGAAAVLLAGMLRLTASGFFAPLEQALEDPLLTSFLVYTQTGRVVRLTPEPPPAPAISQTVPPAPIRETEIADRPVFSADDAARIAVTYQCDYQPDMGSLLEQELDWDLHTDQPSVLILHTHTCESYTRCPGDTYEESGDYRTLDPGYNVLSLGELVANRLEEAGIRVIHDTAFHDYPSYNSSYTNAADSTQAILDANPGIQFVLDLHRDAADTPTGQLVTECAIGSELSAQLMMVVGTDAGGLDNPGWENNLSVALKLHALLEQENPGICRPINFTYHRYNQHLGPHALIVEVGAAGNTLPQAKLAANALADAIIALSNGTDSPN